MVQAPPAGAVRTKRRLVYGGACGKEKDLCLDLLRGLDCHAPASRVVANQ